MVTPDKRRWLQEQVDYMVDNGIAEPSCSSWRSPCLLAHKSDGSDQFCTDFRKVSGVTKPLYWCTDRGVYGPQSSGIVD